MMPPVKLVQGFAPQDVWRGAILPWLAQASKEAWTRTLPTVVLTPSRQHGFFVKSLLLEHGIALAGVHFWTPGECRDALVTRLKHRPVAGVREHLHLLLAAAAEPEPSPLARSVARDPSGLMRALDALSAAGLAWEELPHPSLHPVIARFRKSLDRLGWTTVQHIDRLLTEHEGKALDRLLVVGFDGAHWPLWNLLQAAVAAANAATVCLAAPRIKSENLDQAWIGSWEERHGAAEPVAGDTEPGPFAPLAERMENPESATKVPHGALIRIGYDLREQARAAAAQVLAFLCDDPPERIGIVVPGYGALSREIAAELLRHGVVFNDTIGFQSAPAPLETGWRAWLALQAAPDLGALLEFIKHAPDRSPAPYEHVADALVRASHETLVHDLTVLAAYLRDASRETDRAIGTWLTGLDLLPDRAPFGDFVKSTQSALPLFGDAERTYAVRAHAAAVGAGFDATIDRSTYLSWLETVSQASFRVRDPASTHPFARVHLLTYAQAEGQGWSHLVLAGLNESVWPPRQDPVPFLSDATIDAFNKSAVQQGRQGEGHTTVKPGRALMPGPTQRRALLQRQLYSLVESARHGLCLTASLTDEADPSRHLLPSEYLTYLHFIQHGESLSEERAAFLQRETKTWIEPLAPARTKIDVAPVRAAYVARRTMGQPFGPFEFAPKRAPTVSAVISCQRWESVVRSPALQWLDLYCGCRCLDLDPTEDGRELTRGSWIHRWLGHAIGPARHGASPWPDSASLFGRLDKAAAETYDRVAAAYTGARRKVPLRLIAALRDARWMALGLAREIEAVRGWPEVFTERELPEGLACDTGDGTLKLVGRMDLLLVRGKKSAWIVDFKTGATKVLTGKTFPNRIKDGGGVQLALYVLAVRELGVGDVMASLQVPNQGAAPQIALADVLACADAWRELCRMQDTGIFGMREELRPEYGHGAAFPLATLAIDKDILDEKWAFTHPALSGGEEA
jgi:hypothetical protein